VIGEPALLGDHLAKWVAEGRATARNWTDLYLAAVALGHGLRLVTFDKGFKNLPGLEVLLLKPTEAEDRE
jgi:predicted nucleic acid-binding protein